MSVLFLVFAGIVMSRPPVFIKEMSEEEAKVGSHNAFVVAGMYAATMFLAIFMYMHRSKQERLKLGRSSSAKTAAAIGLGDDTDAFNAPLVSGASTGGATSASVADTSSRQSSERNSKKKKSKSKSSEAITSI
jgi:hypothetical protein